MNLQYDNYCVYIIDNGSENQSINTILEWGKNHEGFSKRDKSNFQERVKKNSILFIESSYNGGFSYGNNIVLRTLTKNKEEFVWMLNPDMISAKDTLAKLVSNYAPMTLYGTPTFSSTSKELMLHSGACHINKFLSTISFIKDPSAQKIDYINGGSLFYSTEDLNIIGIFPESFFLYWEETYWCKKALELGYALRVNLEAKVWDKGSTTIGKGRIAEYYYTRNALYYQKEFNGLILPINIVFQCSRILLRFITFQPDRARGIIKGLWHFIIGRKGKIND